MTHHTPRQNPRTLLSALWVFFLMNIIFHDIHRFFVPGFMDELLTGEMGGRAVTDAILLMGGVAFEAMILMVTPHVLARRALRIANSLAVAFAVVLAPSTPPSDPDDLFFLIIRLATLAAAAWFGWTRFAPAAREG